MKYNLLFIFLLLFCGCEKTKDENLFSERIYFQYEYINYAWGYQHSGFIITPDGKVYTFNKPVGWNFPDEGVLDIVQMDENLDQCSWAEKQINDEELKKYKKMVLSARYGSLSEPETVMADAGILVSSSFIPDRSHPSLLYEVLMSQTGDVEQFNQSSAAEKITEWLNSIHSELLQNQSQQ